MRTILLADDNVHILEHCRRQLEDDGYRVVVARNGAEALSICEEALPDLAVLDISMPRISGLDALERLKSVAPNLPVILFTAFDDDCLGDPRSRLAMACVEKSEDLAELKRTICRLLDLKPDHLHQGVLRMGLPSESCTTGRCQPQVADNAAR